MLVEEYADIVTPDDGRWTPTTPQNWVWLIRPVWFNSELHQDRHNRKGSLFSVMVTSKPVFPSFETTPTISTATK